MSSLAKYYASKLRGFFSYSREDDVDFNQVLSRFRASIQAELGAQLGRNRDNFDIWQDKFAIPDGTLWRNQISDGIKQSAFFIPIITPRVVNSPHCAFEFQSFLAREEELGRDDLVFPILYIRVPELDDGTWQQNEVLKIVKDRQYLDWREYRYKPLESPEVAERIGKFCLNIANAMRKPWVSPEERRQQQEAAAQQKQAEEQAREEQKQRGAAEAARIADEAKLREKERLEAQQREAEQRRREEALAAKRAEEEQAFAAAKRANTVAALDIFLDGHAGSDFAGEAQKLRKALLARLQAHGQAMASDDRAVLRSFCKTYKNGGDVDEVRARLRVIAPPLKLKLSRPAMAIAATIAAILLVGGGAIWMLNSRPVQVASVPPGPLSNPQAATSSKPTVSVTPVPSPVPTQPPPVPSTPVQQPTELADAGPTASVPVPPSPRPTWADCSPNPAQTTLAMGGTSQPAKIKLTLTKAQRGVIAIRSVAISPDGKTVITAGDDGIIRVWDAATLKWIRQIAGHGSPIYSLAFSIDSNFLASASFDGSVRVWDGHNFTPVGAPFTVTDDKGPVKQYGVAFEAKNNPEYVLSVGADGMVRKWDLHTGQLAKPPVPSGSGAHPTTGSLSFVPNESGSYATANFNGTIGFFDPGRTDTINAFPGGVALRLAYSPDGTLVAAAGADTGETSGVKILNAATHALSKALPAHHGHAASVAWSHDRTRLATGGGFSDPSVALWDVQSGKQLPQFNGHTADIDTKDFENRDVEAVAFHPNQKWLVSASESGKMKIWDLANGNELLTVVAISGGSDYVAYTPNGCYTGSANAASYVRYVASGGDQSGTALLVPNGDTGFLLPQ